MTQVSLKTPVVFCVFNRPEPTQQVFNSIRQARPARLLLVGDGARADRADEALKVEQVREIVEQVDWDCDVTSDFSKINLGCKRRIATGLDWAFEQADELIILEDDCLPDPSFFGYCQSLLHRYRDDERVTMISGDNFQPAPRSEDSYYFSRWAHIWGWATWKRAWNHFDVDVASWPSVRDQGLLRPLMISDEEYEFWSATLNAQYAGEIDTWDFPWLYSMWINEGLCVLPERNLITNLGFGSDATHTTDIDSKLANLKSHSIPVFPNGDLIHPDTVCANEQADCYSWETLFKPSLNSAANSASKARKSRDARSIAKRLWSKLTGQKVTSRNEKVA